VEIGFSWDGAQLLLRQKRRANDERTTAVVLRDPPAADEPRDGDWYWADGGLRGSWVRSEARGSSSYRLDPISETLLVEQRIEITALDGVEPIVFELRFGRAQGTSKPLILGRAVAPRAMPPCDALPGPGGKLPAE
jgi:hypothetical protein